MFSNGNRGRMVAIEVENIAIGGGVESNEGRYSGEDEDVC
jgi:hypothetical protein